MNRFYRSVCATILAIFTCVGVITAPVFAEPENSTPESGQNTQSDTETTEPPKTNDKDQPAEQNPDDKDQPAEQDPDKSKEAEAEGKDSCLHEAGAIGWLICPGAGFLSDSIDGIYGAIEHFLKVDIISTKEDSPVRIAWNYFRNLSNIAFICVFVIVIYSQLTGLGLKNYGIKRMLPRLIIAAIMVNLSYVICLLAIDISNITGYGLRSFFDEIGELALTTGQVSEYARGLNFGILTAAVLGGGTAAGIAGLATVGGFSGLLWVLLPILGSGVCAVVAALFTLAARQALIVLLTMISPLAIVAYLLPNTEKWFDKWRQLFVSMLVFFPMFSVLYGATNLAGLIVITSASDPFGVLLGMGIMVIPLAMTLPLLRMSGTLPGKAGEVIRKMTAKPEDALRRVSESHQQIAKQRQLATQNAAAPSTHLAQWMEKRKAMHELEVKDLNDVNKSRYTAAASDARYINKRTGEFTDAAYEHYANIRSVMESQNTIDSYDNLFDKGIDNDDLRVNANDRTALKALNDKYDQTLNMRTMVSAARAINDRNSAYERSQALAAALNANADNNPDLQNLYTALGDNYLTTAQINALSADKRQKYEARRSIAISQSIATAIKDHRAQDDAALKKYTADLSIMPAGSGPSDFLIDGFNAEDYNKIIAGMSELNKRGDHEALDDILEQYSRIMERNPAVRGYLTDYMLTIKSNNVMLQAYAKALKMRQGKHAAGVAIADFISFEDFVADKRLADDISDKAFKDVSRAAIMASSSENTHMKTQDRTTFKYYKKKKLQGNIAFNDFIFSEKQNKSALLSGNSGNYLDALIDLYFMGAQNYDNLDAVNKNYVDAHKDELKERAVNFAKNLSVSELSSQLKSDVFMAMNNTLINCSDDRDAESMDVTIDGKVVKISKTLYQAFKAQRNELRNGSKNKFANINTKVAKLIGIMDDDGNLIKRDR